MCLGSKKSEVSFTPHLPSHWGSSDKARHAATPSHKIRLCDVLSFACSVKMKFLTSCQRIWDWQYIILTKAHYDQMSAWSKRHGDQLKAWVWTGGDRCTKYLEAEIMVSELKSKGVAMDVTQPVWPSSVPLRPKVSAMIVPGAANQKESDSWQRPPASAQERPP